MREKIQPTEQVKRLVRAAFPEYRGRKYRLEFATQHNCRSYWDGGSRDYFTFVRLDNLATLEMPASSMYDKVAASVERLPIPVGAALVERSVFCGKDGGITIYLNPSSFADTQRLIGVAPTQSAPVVSGLIASSSLRSEGK